MNLSRLTGALAYRMPAGHGRVLLIIHSPPAAAAAAAGQVLALTQKAGHRIAKTDTSEELAGAQLHDRPVTNWAVADWRGAIIAGGSAAAAEDRPEIARRRYEAH